MEKRPGTEQGRGDIAAAVEKALQQTFTCVGTGCVVTEKPDEMFNLGCDPASTSFKALREKVLCLRCAEDAVRRRGKRLGEPECGVYSLAKTLAAMARMAVAPASDADEEIFACKHEGGCDQSGPARQFFNLSCNLSKIGLEDLRQLARCRLHAEMIAAKRGKRLGEPECGVYPMVHTLKRVTGTGLSPQEKKDLETRDWVLKGQRDRERRVREQAVADYARAYVAADVFDERGAAGIAKPFPNPGPDGTHLCGLPLNCCRHDVPANRFIVSFGEVAGICDLAARVFFDIVKAHEAEHGTDFIVDKRYQRLLSTDDLERARSIAERWYGEGGAGS